MKKTISLFLVLLMVVALIPTFASAEEYTKLTWAMGTGATAPIDNALVLEELNKISREKLGVEVDIQYFTNDELQISIESGEVFDMYYTCSWYNNFNVAVSKGLFVDIWPYLQEYAPDLYATMPENVWELAKSTDGGLYAIPVKKDYCPMNFIVYDKGFADANGFEIPDRINAFDDMTDYLVALQASMPEGEYAVTVGGGPAGIDTSFDFIDRSVQIGVIFGAEDATKVCVSFDDPQVMERYRTMYKWNQMGMVNPDAPTLTETSVDSTHNHIKFVQAWPGYDYTPSWGYLCGMTCYSGPFLSTDGVQGSMNALSITLEDDPERLIKCLQYQELVNTDLQYRDTLRYGIEGVHFNYVDFTQEDGSVKKAVLRTELGSSNYTPWAFSQGSYALSSIETSQKAIDGIDPAPVLDQWDQYFDACENATVSAICGFTFNSENFQNEYAEIAAIKAEYMNNISCGTVDPDVAVPEMLEKMYAAGLQDIIDEAQRQLDEYLASK